MGSARLIGVDVDGSWSPQLAGDFLVLDQAGIGPARPASPIFLERLEFHLAMVAFAANRQASRRRIAARTCHYHTDAGGT